MNLRLPFLLFSLLVAGTASGQTATLDFISQGSALLSFGPGAGDGTLSMTPEPVSGDDIEIASAIAGNYGMCGTIGGTVTIGPAAGGAGGSADYSLTGLSEFSVYDGYSNYLTGYISWIGAKGSVLSGIFLPQQGESDEILTYSGASIPLARIAKNFNEAGGATVELQLPESLA